MRMNGVLPHPGELYPVIKHLAHMGLSQCSAGDERRPPSAQVIITCASKNCATPCPCLSPAKAWSADGLGRAPGNSVKGGRAIEKKQRPLQQGAVQRAINPTQSQLLDPESPQAFMLLVWPPPHPKPFPLLHPVLVTPQGASKRLLPALYPTRKCLTRTRVWEGGAPALSPAEIGFLFSECWQGPGLDNRAHVPTSPVFPAQVVKF